MKTINKLTDIIINLLKEEHPDLSNPKGFDPPDRYIHNGIKVPRVTSILDKVINKPGLVEWANSLGFKHLGYHKVLNEAATIGTQTHNYIENYIKNDIKNTVEYKEVYSCVSAFHKWWEDINSKYKVKVLGEEKKLTCPWFGGTYDILLDLDGEKILIDFKTSNQVNTEYFYQLAAYRYLINENYNYDIDSCMILKFSKVDGSYETVYIDLHTKNGMEFMSHCHDTFFSLVNAYFKICRTDYEYKKLLKGEDIT